MARGLRTVAPNDPQNDLILIRLHGESRITIKVGGFIFNRIYIYRHLLVYNRSPVRSRILREFLWLYPCESYSYIVYMHLCYSSRSYIDRYKYADICDFMQWRRGCFSVACVLRR